MTDVWESLGGKEILRVGDRLSVRLEHVRLPDGREIEDYLQYSSQDFVVILAATTDGRIICERQYKHGARRVILTLPAGIIETGEEAATAARRELLEETGYASDDWQFLSDRVMFANAGGARTYAFLAKNCTKVAEPNSGDLEEMRIELKAPDELLKAACADEMPLVSDIAALLPGLIALGVLKQSGAR